MGLRDRLARLRRRSRRRPAGPVLARRSASATGPEPIVPDTRTWREVGGVRRDAAAPIQLTDSRAEPGGAPVRVDPRMVNPATAERMRPLFRR